MSSVPLSKSTVFLSISILLVSLLAGAAGQNKPDFTRALNIARVTAPLTNEEIALAIRMAEQAIKSNNIVTDKKTYLTDMHFFRDPDAEDKGIFERRAAMTYYRYAGDLTVQIFINLTQKQLLAVKQFTNRPTPISGEELGLAKQMALNDPQIKSAVAPYHDYLVIDALVSRSESPASPVYRHRVVNLLFHAGPRYLMLNSLVFVDLTAEKVIIEPVKREPAPKKPAM